MIARLRKMLAGEPAPDAGAEIRLAAAVLLAEAALLDGQLQEAERQRIENRLRLRFDLDEEEAAELTRLAEGRASDAVDLHAFTRVLKTHFDHDQRIDMLEMLWEIVMGDGEIDAFEANLLRRVGGLLYVSDRESGLARQRVAARLQGTG